MTIETITKYKYKGKEYNSLEEIQDEIHNIIGLEVLDKINRVCPPEKHENIIKMLKVLCLPEVRKVLTECYSVTFEEETQDFENGAFDYETINILDL